MMVTTMANKPHPRTDYVLACFAIDKHLVEPFTNPQLNDLLGKADKHRAQNMSRCGLLKKVGRSTYELSEYAHRWMTKTEKVVEDYQELK